MTSRPEIMNDPLHTAIHEAGHAVIGRKLGLDMGQASVEQDEDSAGHSIVGDPFVTLERWWNEGRTHREFGSVVRARVMMLMAGAEAERVILGRLQEVDGETGDGEDRREIDRVMESHPGDLAGDPARLIQMRRAVRRLVTHHRDVIEHVAAELRGRGTMPGHELDEMVPGPAPCAPDPLWEALQLAEPEGEPVKLYGASKAKS